MKRILVSAVSLGLVGLLSGCGGGSGSSSSSSSSSPSSSSPSSSSSSSSSPSSSFSSSSSSSSLFTGISTSSSSSQSSEYSDGGNCLYLVNLNREEQDIYVETTTNDIFKTRYCPEYAFYEDVIFDSCLNELYFKDFSGEYNNYCFLDGVYTQGSIDAGTYLINLHYSLGGYHYNSTYDFFVIAPLCGIFGDFDDLVLESSGSMGTLIMNQGSFLESSCSVNAFYLKLF